jgi:hypothetical protein
MEPQPEIDWRARCRLALALVNQRKPTERLVELIRLALEGATVQDLLEIEQLHR